MTAVDVIAGTIHHTKCDCPLWTPWIDDDPDVAAAVAVVAAIRAMSPADLAELTEGTVERLAGYAVMPDGTADLVARCVTPWVAEGEQP